MKAVRVDDPADFLELAAPLLADEARHNLMLGIAGTLLTQPEVYPEYRLWVVRDGGRPVAAALRTPPHHLVVADPLDPSALEPLLGAALETDGDAEGVVANAPFAQAAAAIWTSLTGSVVALEFPQGVFELTEVTDVPRPPGTARPVLSRDRDLAIAWTNAFADEALMHQPRDRERIARTVDARLGREDVGFRFWELDGEPVSLAGFSGPTTSGIRVGPVYTPPEHRGRGYATALVADLSREMLARGFRACFLFTDLSNPTSNAIYERIGYRRVAEAYEIRFGAPSS